MVGAMDDPEGTRQSNGALHGLVGREESQVTLTVAVTEFSSSITLRKVEVLPCVGVEPCGRGAALQHMVPMMLCF